MKSPLLSKGWSGEGGEGVSSPCTTVNTSYILIRCQRNVWSARENLSRIPGWERAERENKGKELSPESWVVLVTAMVLVEGSLPISSLYSLTLSPLPYSLHCLSIFTYPSGYLPTVPQIPHCTAVCTSTLRNRSCHIQLRHCQQILQNETPKVIRCCLLSNKINKINHRCAHAQWWCLFAIKCCSKSQGPPENPEEWGWGRVFIPATHEVCSEAVH